LGKKPPVARPEMHSALKVTPIPSRGTELSFTSLDEP
jgi:hypothetical protein